MVTLGKWLARPEPQEASLHGTCTWGRWESHTDDTLKCPLSDLSCCHHSLEKLGCALPLRHKGLTLSTLLPSKKQPVWAALTCLACTNSLFPGASPFPGFWFKQALSVGPTCPVKGPLHEPQMGIDRAVVRAAQQWWAALAWPGPP